MNIEKRVKDTIEKYGLLRKDKKEKVVVALSGGKDSTSVLYLLHKLGYDVDGLMIDLKLGKWSELNRQNMKQFCDALGIDFYVIDLRKEFGNGICFIRQKVKQYKGNERLTDCYICGIVKTWLLNKKAKQLKADKLVTGHNLDDELQTVLMNFLKGNIKLGLNSSPSTGSLNKDNKSNMDEVKRGFVQRIKPLFFIPENDIREYSNKKKLPVVYEKCPCSSYSYRIKTREWIESLELDNIQKLEIVRNFQKLIPKIKPDTSEKGDSGILQYCSVCGEPCKSEICKFCQILNNKIV